MIEHRSYAKNKFIVIKFRAINKTSPGEESKNDKIKSDVWRIMKYTQGENERKIKMKLIMPVFVHVENLVENGSDTAIDEVEIKIMVSLPKEYQINLSEEPPKPNDPSITFEIFNDFECYVR